MMTVFEKMTAFIFNRLSREGLVIFLCGIITGCAITVFLLLAGLSVHAAERARTSQEHIAYLDKQIDDLEAQKADLVATHQTNQRKIVLLEDRISEQEISIVAAQTQIAALTAVINTAAHIDSRCNPIRERISNTHKELKLKELEMAAASPSLVFGRQAETRSADDLYTRKLQQGEAIEARLEALKQELDECVMPENR